MPSAKQAAWIVGLALLTVLGLEHYRARSGGGAGGKSGSALIGR